MSDNRKYYYLKLKENFFTTEKMVILESAQDGLLYSNLLLKMCLMSLKRQKLLLSGLHDFIFVNDNGHNPLMEKACAYVGIL